MNPPTTTHQTERPDSPPVVNPQNIAQSSPNSTHVSSSQETNAQMPHGNDANAPQMPHGNTTNAPLHPQENHQQENASTSYNGNATPISSEKHPEEANEANVSSDPKEKSHSMPSTPDSSPPRSSDHPAVYYIVSPRGPINCTKDDLRTLPNKSFLKILRQKWKKNPNMDDEGFTMVERK